MLLGTHSAWRIDLARRYVAPYAERAQTGVLGGSVAQGVADRWSDIDTIVYWDNIDRGWLETPRAAENGERFTWVEHYPGNACLEQYRFGTVKADVAHVRLGWLDELIDGVLSGENTDTTSLDVLRGVQESIVLFGEERYEPIRARVLDYPEALRRSMVEAHPKFSPSWIYDGMGRDRGDLVVFYEYVLATMRNVVGVLAGLNRVYVAPDKLRPARGRARRCATCQRTAPDPRHLGLVRRRGWGRLRRLAGVGLRGERSSRHLRCVRAATQPDRHEPEASRTEVLPAEGAAARLLRAAGEPKQMWKVPVASHTGGIDAQPAEFERRVIAFLDGALPAR